MTDGQTSETLTPAQQMAATREQMAQFMPPPMIEAQGKMIAGLEQTQVPQVPDVGDVAPDFTLVALDGTRVTLSEAAAKGPVVVSFYRGEWCIFCNFEVQGLQQRHDEIRSLGGEIYLVGPETSEYARQFAEKTHTTIPVLLDEDGAVMERYKLAFTLPAALQDVYENQFNYNLPQRNAKTGWRLPIPATFVVDKERRIRSRHVMADYTHRMDADDVVEAVRSIV